MSEPTAAPEAGGTRLISRVRVRVTLAATSAALVAAVLGSGLFLGSLQRSMQNQLMSSAQQAAQGVQAQLSSGVRQRNAVLTGKNDIVVQIVSRFGIVIATDHPRVVTPLRSSPGAAEDVTVDRLVDNYIVYAQKVKGSTDLIVVGRSTEQVEHAIEVSAILLAISVPIGLALLALAVWLSVGRALRPVESMRREAASITAEHLDRRLAVPGGDDEIPRLALTLNQMLDRIDAGSVAQRQFVSDASHELRSPLAALRQLAEVARDYPDRVSQQSLVRDVLEEEQRMEELVTALLLLARLDHRAPTHDPDAEPVDLDDLVLTQARRLRRDDARVDVSGVSAGQVVGDPVLLAQVVGNLLGNALRHCDGQVAVALHEYADQVVLTVDDDGAGISEADRGRVFERFVRLDEARARDAGGSGLGLAIVRKVVDDLGGSVRVGESDLGGARFVVSLPAS